MRLALVLVLLAGEAQALSCMRPTIANSFARAEAVPDSVYLLKGALSFDESLLPDRDMLQPEKDPAPIEAQFKGMALSRDGFTTPYNRSVTLQPLCFGPWCGQAISEEPAIIFATVRGDDLVIEVNPCGGQIFYEPTPQMDAAAIACMNGRCPG